MPINQNNHKLKFLEDFVSDPDLALLEANLNNFNIMDVFKIRTSETSISAFLSWILDPLENHGMTNYFLKYFLIECAKISNDFNVIDIDNLSLNNAIVRTEENFAGNKADITIRIDTDKFICFIENKIKSIEGSEQTRKYLKLSKRKYPDYRFLYVYLTPSGIEAEALEFLPLSYQMIKRLINQTINANIDNANEEVIFLLKQFINNLEVNILEEGNIVELCKKIYERHKEAIEFIIANKPQYMTKVEDEMKILLNSDWQTHSTRSYCYIFKKKWLEDFQKFSSIVPFFFYIIISWIKDGVLNLGVEFYIDKPRGENINLREKFTQELDKIFLENSPKSFHYLKSNRAVKFKKVILTNGYENDEDLRDVALEMQKLINQTIEGIDEAISKLKIKIQEDL